METKDKIAIFAAAVAALAVIPPWISMARTGSAEKPSIQQTGTGNVANINSPVTNVFNQYATMWLDGAGLSSQRDLPSRQPTKQKPDPKPLESILPARSPERVTVLGEGDAQRSTQATDDALTVPKPRSADSAITLPTSPLGLPPSGGASSGAVALPKALFSESVGLSFMLESCSAFVAHSMLCFIHITNDTNHPTRFILQNTLRLSLLDTNGNATGIAPLRVLKLSPDGNWADVKDSTVDYVPALDGRWLALEFPTLLDWTFKYFGSGAIRARFEAKILNKNEFKTYGPEFSVLIVPSRGNAITPR